MPEVGFDKSPLHNLPGCYHTLWAVLFNKLPFGIFSAPEIFQKMINNILEDIRGVLHHMDDVLVYGKDNQEHDSCLTAVLKRIKATGITLNPIKCEFSRSSLTFLGHLINQKGISQEPAKISAIKDMPPPKNVTELQRFLGMVNQQGSSPPTSLTYQLHYRIY